MKLAEMKCKPCKGWIAPLKGSELTELLCQLDNWDLVMEHHIKKSFTFPNFERGLAFVEKVGQIAEQEQHHPDVFLTWGKVIIELYTHAIDGLSESDFILAAKIDALQSGQWVRDR